MMKVIEKPLDLPGTRTIVSDLWHRSPVAIQVADTDYGGGVYHGKYFALYNQARDVFMEDLGVSYFSLMNKGMNLSVAELHTRYLKPVSYGELIEVLTRISWLRSRSMGVVQQMVSVDPDTGEEILKNQVEMNLVCTGTKIGAVPLPDELLHAFEQYYGKDGIKVV